jgi:DNA-binding MarR family transcriptional regulator
MPLHVTQLQLDAAAVPGIRTAMATRENVVELTDAGRGAVQQAAEAVGQAERDFLGPLSAAEAAQFKKILHMLLEDADRSDAAG